MVIQILQDTWVVVRDHVLVLQYTLLHLGEVHELHRVFLILLEVLQVLELLELA